MKNEKRNFIEKAELPNDPNDIPETQTGNPIEKGDQPKASNTEETIKENSSTREKS